MAQIRIVLVETSHPGNIGAAARAMKAMGLYELALVAPKHFPHPEATARAAGADDVLSKAQVCSSLQEAVADCQLVIGTSARARKVPWPRLSPRQCAQLLKHEAPATQVAIVFGRERCGLTNQELDLCHYRLFIPCNPDFSSLNVAAAVQIVCYELYLLGIKEEQGVGEDRLATHAELESFYAHLYQTLLDIQFLHSTKQGPSIMRRLRRLFGRARLEKKEVDILRGILTCAQRRGKV
nr:tRNA/rRNA methyltransferase [uncultured Gammaproteobacteria bacterium]